ncbi:hypothetical protein [Chondromyces crocatus]|uniref:Uncharacterized protein n=1 Tax=Chondromyces crocatus TaxID=52 RepID=A0A0K1ES47_CHOCO|nr:hypothetical protein [Chondromyces crocatus]AKT43681.1 uncharacterized protein CMC5_079160 [Chondromyces crocatus]
MQAAPTPPYGPPMQPPAPLPPTPPKKFPTWLLILLCLIPVGIGALGVMATLAVYGVRRYMVAAKTAEARHNIKAITRATAAAFESSAQVPGEAGRLCDSARPVPVEIPAGGKYVPGYVDWETGSETEGWTCLRFFIITPTHYQYHYNHGSGYLATTSNAAPGALDFEAAARGDLDADGTTSLFAMTGKVDEGNLTLSPQVIVENETE